MLRGLIFGVCTVVAAAGCGARTGLGDADRDVGGAGGAGAREICNGLDDDLDGDVDEGLGTITCGVGACRVEVAACIDGSPATCVPGSPSPEVCNGEDDDCDGAVDEDLGLARVAGPFTLDPSLNYLAYASVVPSDDGFVFAYGTGFNGSNPQTNVFYGVLDASGAPVTTKAPLTTLNMANGLTLSRADGGFLASYCGRYGSEDRAAIGWLSDALEFTDFGVRPPASNHCGAGTPGGIATGDRLLFGWTDNSIFDVRLDVSSNDGASLDTVTLAPGDGDLYSHPRFAKLGDLVLATYSALVDGVFLLRVHRLDPLGQEVAPPLELTAPIGTNWTDAQVVAGAAGFFIWARGASGERIEARLDASGELVSGPTLTGETMGQHALASDGGGGFVVASTAISDATYDSVVERRDSSGQLHDSWRGSRDPGFGLDVFGWPTIASAHGRIVVVYTALGSGDGGDHPELHAIALGCEATP
ncbi:MAG: hypothetical protein U0271_44060 [Polyangiaceae bacterium]